MATQEQIDEINAVLQGKKSKEEAKAVVIGLDKNSNKSKKKNKSKQNTPVITPKPEVVATREQDGYIYSVDSNGGFETTSRPFEAQRQLDMTIALNNRINRGDDIRARDLAYGSNKVKLIDSDTTYTFDDSTKARVISPNQRTQQQAIGGYTTYSKAETKRRNDAINRNKNNVPFFYGYDAVASTVNDGYVYQGANTGASSQFVALPKDVGSNIKSYSLTSTQKPTKSWVDRYNTNPLQNTGTYDRKITSRNSITSSTARFAGLNNNLIDVKYGKTAVQQIQLLPKAEIIQFTGNVGKGAGQVGVELGKVGVEIGKGLYSRLDQGLTKVGMATGLYGNIGIANDGVYRKASISQRANLFATGNVEVASTLAVSSSSGFKLLNSKPLRTLFNTAQFGFAGYEVYKFASNPTDVQLGRTLAASTLGLYGALGIYSDVVKPKIIRTIVNREVPDTYLSPVAKAPQPEAYFKNVVFGDIRLDVKPAFDNPQGRTAKERYAEVQRRIADATTERKVVKYLKTNKLYSTNPDLAGNTFIVTQNRQRVAKQYVELTTSAQAGVKGNKIGGSPKSVAGIEEDILFMSAKGYGEPAFLRIQNTGANSAGYSLAPSIFDYFKTPTLFNTKVRGVKLLPPSVRYAKYEGIDKANAFYRSQANVGEIYGYITLRSSASLGKSRPSIITVKQDYTFENGKVLTKGTRMKMGLTKEDEIAQGSEQGFRLLKSRGWRGYLANKLYGSTTKRIELDLGGEKVPIPLQEAKLTSRKGIKPTYLSRSAKPKNLKEMQKQLDDVSESYIRQRKSLPKASSVTSRPSTVSRVSSIIRTSFTSSPPTTSRTSYTSTYLRLKLRRRVVVGLSNLCS